MKRDAKLAGKWYPSSRLELKSQIRKSIKNSIKLDSCIAGVVPHAGYKFSINSIANTFANLSKDLTTGILFAPSHYNYLDKDKLYAAQFTEYETPIGNINGFIVDNPNFEDGTPYIDREHSVELILPFIKHSNIKNLLVILVPEITSYNSLLKLTKLVLDTVKEFKIEQSTAYFASSDFTHYGDKFDYNPYFDEISEQVKKNDLRYAKNIINSNLELLIDEYRIEKPTICGFHSMLLLSSIMKQHNRVGKIVDYYNSNDILVKNNDDFVSYCSLIF